MGASIRDLTSLAECRAVVDVQVAVWGRDGEVVPASLLSASVKRGGILIGAFARWQTRRVRVVDARIARWAPDALVAHAGRPA